MTEGSERVLMGAKGENGRLELLEDKVRIRRKGLGSWGLGGDKNIPVEQISSVQFRNAGLAHGGYIRFVLGGQDAPREMGGLKAARDVDAVVFNTFQKKPFEAIRQAIQRRIDERGVPAEVPPSAPSAGARADKKKPGPEVAGGVEILDDRARKMLERNLNPGEEPEFVLLGQRIGERSKTDTALVALPDRVITLHYGLQATGGLILPGGEDAYSYDYGDLLGFAVQRRLVTAVIKPLQPGAGLQVSREVTIDKSRADEYQPYVTRLNEKVQAARRALREAPATADLATEIERLATLRDSGALTEEEFRKAKAKLLEG